ncbi:MAG TPA: cytochrome b/b6 domain-containing protein [Capsulimonadaceae bacterium]|nr:cytochrome b/b6 domain-containing protein [Capsulimonadaceae bacterium]
MRTILLQSRIPCVMIAPNGMADSVFIPALAARPSEPTTAPHHSLLIRITHWINLVSFIGLVVSGVAILLAHPRFYWGETGGVDGPSLFDLPLPFMLGGPSGWGRYMHFQSAWLCVLTGLVYVASGIASGHFRRGLAPTYSRLQRTTYFGVIFALFPLIIWTGLAMSPAVTSVFPFLVDWLGGHQSARTIHFFCAIALVLFLFVHIIMVARAGFVAHIRSMITGRL